MRSAHGARIGSVRSGPMAVLRVSWGARGAFMVLCRFLGALLPPNLGRAEGCAMVE